MGKQMFPYVVRQGDYLAKLAFRHGFDVDEVWNDPKNDDLRKLRSDHHILAPGDIVYLPVAPQEGLPLTKGVVNRYVAKVPKVPLQIQFRGSDGPMANRPFVVEGNATPSEGATDADGNVTLMVPVHVAEIVVRFTDDGPAVRVRIGHLDPITEPSGVASRLANLGYLRSSRVVERVGKVPWWATPEAQLRRAVEAFQRASGLEPTGEVDEATRAALEEAYGA